MGHHTPEIVARTLGVGAWVDTAFGLEEHPKKRKLFTNMDSGYDALRPLVATKGRVCFTFQLLGVGYDCRSKRNQPMNQEEWDEAIRKWAWIQCAGIGLAKRARYIRTLAQPNAIWSGWKALPGEPMRKFRMQIEKALRGKDGPVHFVGARSAYLMWACYGPHCAPAYEAAIVAVHTHTWRRATHEGRHMHEFLDPSQPVKGVLRGWQWEETPDGSFITADGLLDTMIDGTKAIYEVAEWAWLESIWRKEDRVSETGWPAGPAASGAPCHGAQGMVQSSSKR